MQTARADIDGTALEYVERGRGAPLVLVHGSASDRRTWEAQVSALGTRFRTIAYSRRYHWPNAPIAAGADYAMQRQVDDLRALLPALRAAPAHLAGHSYGALVALHLAMREPRLVRSLVLCEPPAVALFVRNPPRAAELASLLLARPRTALAILKFGATGVAPATAAARRGDMEAAMRVFGRAVLGRASYARLSAARLEQVRANAIQAEFLGSGFPPMQEAAVRSMQVPTLLVGGARSPRLFHRLLDHLEVLLPVSRRVEIAAASHIVHEDNPRAYNVALARFLSEH